MQLSEKLVKITLESTQSNIKDNFPFQLNEQLRSLKETAKLVLICKPLPYEVLISTPQRE